MTPVLALDRASRHPRPDIPADRGVQLDLRRRATSGRSLVPKHTTHSPQAPRCRQNSRASTSPRHGRGHTRQANAVTSREQNHQAHVPELIGEAHRVDGRVGPGLRPPAGSATYSGSSGSGRASSDRNTGRHGVGVGDPADLQQREDQADTGTAQDVARPDSGHRSLHPHRTRGGSTGSRQTGQPCPVHMKGCEATPSELRFGG